MLALPFSTPPRFAHYKNEPGERVGRHGQRQVQAPVAGQRHGRRRRALPRHARDGVEPAVVQRHAQRRVDRDVRVLVEDHQQRALLALGGVRLDVQQRVDAVAVGALQVDEVGVQDDAVLGVPGGVLLDEGLGGGLRLVVQPRAPVARPAPAPLSSDTQVQTGRAFLSGTGLG